MDGCQCTHMHTHTLTHTCTCTEVDYCTFVELDVRQLLYSTQSNCVIHGNDIHIYVCHAVGRYKLRLGLNLVTDTGTYDCVYVADCGRALP